MKNEKEFIAFCTENHLNVAPQDPQWQAVISDKNTVVSAGAGTGKTTVLSFRFLRLVAEKKAKPSEILTITFTRKATAEMKGRIYELLQEAYKRDFISEEDLKDFSNATISTVDGFCSDIVRKNSVELGISRDFGMLSDDELTNISNKIVDELLTEERYGFLLKSFSVSQLYKIFEDLAKSYLNIAKPIDKEDNETKLKAYFEDKLKRLSDSVKASIDYHLDSLNLKPEKREAFNKIHQCCSICSEEALKALNANWDQVHLLRNDLKKEIQEQVSEEIPACMNALLNLSTYSEMIVMAQSYEKKLFARKREKGLLSFGDIMQLTLEILTKNTKQRQAYKKAFRYIMIDEFQDNNDDYRKLLFLLSEKQENLSAYIPTINELEANKIFLVGDQKQSIYRFRGAEVSVFKKLSNELCDKPIELVRNWRSEPEIIHFCNDVFKKVMANPQESDFEADFSDLAIRDKKVETCNIVLLRPEDREKKSEPYAVADFILQAMDTYLIPGKNAEDPPRKLRFNDIGILLKSSSIQGGLEKAFNENHIPYSVTEPKTLMRESIANDFYCALTSAMNSEDRIALASLLKSPFFSIKDKDIPTAMAREIHKDFVEKLRKIIRENSLSEALTWLWNDCGYRSFIMDNAQTKSYASHFDWLYSIACDYEKQGKTALDYTDTLRSYINDKFKDLPEQTVFEEQTQGVQIMTIHKSKGLAFGLVIVCGCDSKGNSSFFSADNRIKEGFLSMRFAPGEEKLINPVEIVEESLDKKKEDAEVKRVLYVAATRPKYHLVFSAPSFKISKSQNTMMDYLATSLGIDDETEDKVIDKNLYKVQIKTMPLSEKKEKKEAAGRKKRNIRVRTTELPLPLVKVNATSLETDEISKDSVKLRELESDSIIDRYELSSKFGTRVHQIIEDTINQKDITNPDWPENLSGSEVETLEKDAKALAASFTASLNRNEVKYYCEKPVVLFDEKENRMIEGRIDLLCEEKDKVIIVDFKTDRFKSPDKHSVQLDIYKRAISLMPCYQGLAVETKVVYLRQL